MTCPHKETELKWVHYNGVQIVQRKCKKCKKVIPDKKLDKENLIRAKEVNKI